MVKVNCKIYNGNANKCDSVQSSNNAAAPFRWSEDADSSQNVILFSRH